MIYSASEFAIHTVHEMTSINDNTYYLCICLGNRLVTCLSNVMMEDVCTCMHHYICNMSNSTC